MILDLDTGIDDALAIAYALASEECDLIGIVGSYGNILVEDGVQNSLDLLELLGRPDIPVFTGLPHASTKDSFEVMPISAQIHGKNGIGEVKLKKLIANQKRCLGSISSSKRHTNMVKTS